MNELLFSILSFILGILSATLYRRAVANDTAEAIDELKAALNHYVAENARLQAELDELRRGLDALGRVDLGG